VSQRFKLVMLAAMLPGAIGALLVAGAAAPENLDAGLTPTTQLLRLMDTDKDGKVSKQEFMGFMSAEFERLDVNKDGELDVKELVGLRVRPVLGTAHR
jgi:hypothetical protein